MVVKKELASEIGRGIIKGVSQQEQVLPAAAQ
jgi:hypothetical protein